MNKLEEQELKTLQDAINKVNNIQIQIGGLEAQKHDLLHAITNATQELQKVQNELEEKYGSVSVDIATGEIKENEPSKED
jgi:ribosomal protein S9